MGRIGGGFVAGRRRENGSVSLVLEAVTVETARTAVLERDRMARLRARSMRKAAWQRECLSPRTSGSR